MPAWAVIVGINHYESKETLPELGGAVADACDFAEWALDPAGANVPPDHLFFWAHPWPDDPGGRLGQFLDADGNRWRQVGAGTAAPEQDRGPYAVEIVKTAQEAGRQSYLAALAAGEDEVRRVYIFFAGHGLRAGEYTNPVQQTCFVAYDFAPVTSSIVSGLVPCESLRKALLTNRFTEAVMFLDCCRTRNEVLAARAEGIVDVTDDPVLPWAVGNAAQNDQVAYETDHPPARGAFSKTLMEALRTHRETDGRLHADELRRYVQTKITDHTSKGQQPSIRCEPDAPPGLLIVQSAAAAPAPPPAMSPGPLVDVSALADGTGLVLKHKQNEVYPTEPLAVAGPSLQLPDLPDGLYSIEVAGSPDRYATFKIPGKANVRVE